jgi:hypothetical protein
LERWCGDRGLSGSKNRALSIAQPLAEMELEEWTSDQAAPISTQRPAASFTQQSANPANAAAFRYRAGAHRTVYAVSRGNHKRFGPRTLVIGEGLGLSQHHQG